MEILAVILFIITLLVLNSLRSSQRNRFEALEASIRLLHEKLAAAPVQKQQPPAVQPVEPVTFQAPTPPVVPRPVSPAPEAIIEPRQEPEAPHQKPIPRPVSAPHQEASLPPVGSPAPPFVRPAAPPPPPRPSFLERNPDLEKFIGENLISKIGIAILVLAIAFFVKYAIDNDWIGPVGRVGIGILCGGILVAVAHRLRNAYKGFSSVLVGGGLAVFYFTITLGYQQFHLFSQTVGFIIMVVITAFAVVLSHLYNRQELAIIALIGGFATPFMVSNGSGNYKVLFSYLLILNGGLLVIAYNKAWRILNLLAFVFTALLFSAWLFNLPVNTPAAVYRGGLLFATLFYLLFLAINIAHNIREKKKFIASDFGILLSNTALYFAAGLYCLSMMGAREYHGLFSAAMGVFNLALSYVLLRRQQLDRNILYLLIGITLTFISLTAPIQLNGNFITLFWACECVLLYWLYQKSRIPVIRIASLIIWVAMLLSLVAVWFDTYIIFYSSSQLPVIANKAFITGVFAAAASYLQYTLRKNGLSRSLPVQWPSKNIFRVAALVLLYLTGIFEISYQFGRYYPLADVDLLYELLYTFVFILLFLALTRRIASLALPWQLYLGFMTLCLVVYLLSLPNVFHIQQTMLTERLYGGHFTAHWVAAIVIAVILYTFVQGLRASGAAFVQNNQVLLTWLVCIAVVIYASAELHLLVNQLYFSGGDSLMRIQTVYVKAGLPILWGLCSFAFMFTGMRYKFRMLRIISLSLFLLTLLKLFVYDIVNIPMVGKIAAFFILGVLLLIIAFMYQRLKTIIIQDENKTPE